MESHPARTAPTTSALAERVPAVQVSGHGDDSEPPRRMPRGDAEALGVRLQQVAAAQASLDHDFISLVDEFDAGRGFGWFDGIKSTTHFVAWACSMSAGPAREHVRVARALRAMPLTKELFRQGRLSYSKVRALTRVGGQVDEAGLVKLALEMTASQLERTVAGFRSAAGTRIRAEWKRELRSAPRPDGMVRLSVTLPPDEAAVIAAAIEAACRRAGEPDEPDRATGDSGAGGGSATILPMADANWPAPGADRVQGLVDVAAGYLAALPNSSPADDHTLVLVHVNATQLAPLEQPQVGGASVSPEASDLVVVASGPDQDQDRPCGNVSAETPADSEPARVTPTAPPAEAGSAETSDPVHAGQVLADGTCYVEGQGPIEPQTAHRLVCNATLIGALVAASGDVLALGRAVRLATRAQRRALRIRDKGICQFDGCHQTHHLEAHHLQPWSRGGPTDIDNLILLCRRHHMHVHEGGVAIHREPGRARRYRFVLPDGRQVTDTWLEQSSAADIESILGAHYRALAADPASAEPRRIFPPHAGAGFSLHECVRVLFAHQVEQQAA